MNHLLSSYQVIKSNNDVAACTWVLADTWLSVKLWASFVCHNLAHFGQVCSLETRHHFCECLHKRSCMHVLKDDENQN